jgi:hypothetical protein
MAATEHRTLVHVARGLFMLGFIVSSGLVVNILQLIIYCLRPVALNWARVSFFVYCLSQRLV